MIRKTRNENFSREEKEFVVRFVNEHLKILENKSNTSEVYLKKRDKWRELTEKLKAFGVVRDWKEVRHAYQRWKWFAKKNITALQKWGDSIPASMSPTEFDYMIYNVCSQEFEDDESNFSNESENNVSEIGTRGGIVVFFLKTKLKKCVYKDVFNFSINRSIMKKIFFL